MSSTVVIRSIIRIALLLSLVLLVLSASASGKDPSEERSISRTNTSQPLHQNGADSIASSGSNIDASQSATHLDEVSSQVNNTAGQSCETKLCNPVSESTSSSVAPPKNVSLNDSNQSESIVHPPDPSIEMSKKLNPEALMRGFYVFVGLTFIVMIYIAWRSCRKRPSQIHRYGVVANQEDLEMAPLDSDEGDEDDTTHFDISKHRLN